MYAGKNGSGSPENTTLPGVPVHNGGVKGMGLYDREQMHAVEDHGDGHG